MEGLETSVFLIIVFLKAHTVTLTLKIGTQPFCMKLQVKLMYQHTKFHEESLIKLFRRYCPDEYCKRFSPHCDLDLEDSNPKLSHNTPAHDDAPLYQAWLQKVKKFRRYGRNS